MLVFANDCVRGVEKFDGPGFWMGNYVKYAPSRVSPLHGQNWEGAFLCVLRALTNPGPNNLNKIYLCVVVDIFGCRGETPTSPFQPPSIESSLHRLKYIR